MMGNFAIIFHDYVECAAGWYVNKEIELPTAVGVLNSNRTTDGRSVVIASATGTDMTDRSSGVTKRSDGPSCTAARAGKTDRFQGNG